MHTIGSAPVVVLLPLPSLDDVPALPPVTSATPVELDPLVAGVDPVELVPVDGLDVVSPPPLPSSESAEGDGLEHAQSSKETPAARRTRSTIARSLRLVVARARVQLGGDSGLNVPMGWGAEAPLGPAAEGSGETPLSGSPGQR